MPGGVTITGTFTDCAEGWFITVTSVSPDGDITCVALTDTGSPAIVTGLGGGSYLVRVYDLEHGGPGRRPAVEIGPIEVREEDSGEGIHIIILPTTLYYIHRK